MTKLSLAVLLAVVASVSARRNLQAWVSDGNDFANTRCQSSRSLFCDNLPENICCSDAFRFASMRINNPENSDIPEGNVPNDNSGFDCGQTVVTGSGGDCISDGLGGIIGVSWSRPRGFSRVKRDVCASTQECRGHQAPNRLLFDGTEFDLTVLSQGQKDSLLSIVQDGSLADIPAEILRFGKK